MSARAPDNSSRLESIIYNSKIFFIVLVSLLVASGIGYAIVQFVMSKSNNQLSLSLEYTDDDYSKIMEEYPLYKMNPEVSIPTEKIQTLIATLDEITDNNKNSFAIQEAYYRKGQLYILLQDYEKSLLEFEKSISIRTTSYIVTKALASAAAVAEELGNTEKTQQYLTQIVDNYPNSLETPHALFNLGRLAEQQDSITEANTAQGYYLSLVNNEKWSSSDWTSLAKSRLAILGYTENTTADDDEATTEPQE